MFSFISKNKLYRFWCRFEIFSVSESFDKHKRYEYHTISLEEEQAEQVWYNYYVESNYYGDVYMYAYIEILHLISDCVWRSLNNSKIRRLISDRFPVILELIRKRHHFDLLHTIIKSEKFEETKKRDFCIELFDDLHDNHQPKWCISTILDLDNPLSKDSWMQLNSQKPFDKYEDWSNESPQDYTRIYMAHYQGFRKIKKTLQLEILNWLNMGLTDPLYVEWEKMSNNGLLPCFTKIKACSIDYIHDTSNVFYTGIPFNNSPESKIYKISWKVPFDYFISEKYTWEILGDGVTDWSTGIKLTKNLEFIFARGGEVKFRANESWDINLGVDSSATKEELLDDEGDLYKSYYDGILKVNGDNICIDEGIFLIYFDPRGDVLFMKLTNNFSNFDSSNNE